MRSEQEIKERISALTNAHDAMKILGDTDGVRLFGVMLAELKWVLNDQDGEDDKAVMAESE